MKIYKQVNYTNTSLFSRVDTGSPRQKTIENTYIPSIDGFMRFNVIRGAIIVNKYYITT